MRAFIRKKLIEGKEYIYEVTPYYDPKTKTIRHKSKYLGKEIGGQIVKVRQNLPKRAYSYGEYLPFIKVVEEYAIRDGLGKYLTREEVEAVVILSINRAVEPLALKHISGWYEGVYLYSADNAVNLILQRLSRLLEKIGKSAVSGWFSKWLLKRLGTKKGLIYDITSLSSHSKLIESLERGYNRDEDGLGQVNISLVVDKEEGIPVMYEIYPGSVVDVSTLVRTVKTLSGYGVRESVMVLDRGFFSTANIEMLEEAGIEYIIGGLLVHKGIKGAMAGVGRQLKDPNNMRVYGDETIFVSEVEVKIGSRMVKGYCYYNPQRRRDEEESFLRKLYEIKKVVEEQKKGCKKREIREAIQRVSGNYSRYLKVRITESGEIGVSIRNNAVSQRVNRMGKFIILYKGQKGWEDILHSYRCKDIIEKGFEMLKNDLELYTPNVHKEDTLRGLMFICFISLILRMRVLKEMKDSGLSEKYSMEGLKVELRKLKKVELTDGTMVTTEQTKKHKEILTKLNLCA